MDQPPEKRTGREDNSFGLIHPGICDDPAHLCILDAQVQDFRLHHRQPCSGGNRFLHRLAIELSVGLRTRAPYSWPLSSVQQPKLDARPIRNPPHQPVQCINLANEMALPETADRRVAGHDTNIVA